jgi:UDP-N-acetylmuramoyl-L-alanyl-D-glutamate--2,6-diaminopimelate ligase
LKITELAGPDCCSSLAADPEILGLSADSRTIEPGFLFVAVEGAAHDGRAFAGEAVARGAVAILTDDPAALHLTAEQRRRVVVVGDPLPQRRLALMASRLCGRQPHTIAAVTGTNGKTSVAHFTRALWAALGCKAASIGTLGLVTPDGRRPGALTTPDPVALHRDLAALARGGVEYVAIEASSHGLDQHRLDGLVLEAAAFTNLTRDHLDYHRDMEAYRVAKERLFRDLLRPGGGAVLNADSEEFPRLAALCRERGHRVLAYGEAAAELRLVACEPLGAAQRLTIDILGHRARPLLPLVGKFQAMNVLAALGLVVAAGADVAAATAALDTIEGVPGRLQLVATLAGGGEIYVDYAHTPDALETVLRALRPHAKGRLVALFGCGGDRDRGKRPQMGRVATALADRVYVTDDNPRTEPAAAIRRAILDAAPDAIEIGDRGAAIAAAIAELRPDDILVLAGKGHETGQIVGDEILPFDDAVVAREAARSWWKA